MSAISENPLRIGNLTSGSIAALATTDRSGKGWGKPALTYIAEKNFERRLGRSLSNEIDTRPTSFGKLCESVVFPMLVKEAGYSYNSQETLVHPLFDYWAGTPDGFHFNEGKKTVVDMKCPFTLKSFCTLVQPLYEGLEGMAAMNHIRDNHKEGDTYYYQILSNAIISDCDYGELLVYCPYESELDAIIHAAGESGNGEYYWLSNIDSKNKLPYLKEDGYYSNINRIQFPISQSDKELLTNLVIKAGELLINI